MIQVYTGVPGAGKSYKMVADLKAYLEKVEKMNAKASDWSEVQNFTVIANIRGLNGEKLSHINFDDYIVECFPQPDLSMADRIEKFFDYEHQKSLNEKFGGPVLYVIDECQLYFPRGSKLPRTEAYFQRHRHLGHYVFLATQTLSRSVNGNLVALIEIEYTAVRRSFSFVGEFRYQVRTPGVRESFSTIIVYPKQEIFNLYTSFEAAEIKKPRKEILRKLMLPLIFFPVAFYLFYDNALNPEKFGGRSRDRNPAQSVQSAVPGSVTVPGPRSSLPVVPEKERVFLSVVLVGGKKMTIDPDTRAYTEVKNIKHRVTCTGDEGLNCYFDRVAAEAVKVAGANEYGGSYSPPYQGTRNSTIYTPQSTPKQEGPAISIPAELVPEPDKSWWIYER